MTGNGRAFEPGELDVMKYIFDEVYSMLEYDGERDRFTHKGGADIELTKEEYSHLQNVLEKLGITIY